MTRELETQRTHATNLVQDYMRGDMSRRDLIRKAGLAGISVPVLTAAMGAQGAFGQASPAASPAGSPVAEAPLELGDFSGRELRVKIALAETETAGLNEIVVGPFQEATGATVTLSNIEAIDVVNTLTAQVGSGNVALDLLVQDNNTLAPLVNGGLVDPIPEAEDVLPPTVIPALLDVSKFDDTYYFLPARPNVQITYYNSDTFGELGLEPPTTWDDLTAVGQALLDNAGVGQISIQGVSGSAVGVTVVQFLWQAGADPLEINTDEGKTAFQYLQDLKQYLTPQYPTATFNTTNDYLLNETVQIAQNWPFGVNVIVGDGGKTEVLAYAGWEGPAGNALVLGGDVFGIVKDSPNRDIALDFIRFWNTLDVQEQLTARVGWPSIRTDALGQVEDWQQPYFAVVSEALAVTKPRPNVTYWTDVENILSNAFNDIVTGGAEVASTLDRYQGEIDALKG